MDAPECDCIKQRQARMRAIERRSRRFSIEIKRTAQRRKIEYDRIVARSEKLTTEVLLKRGWRPTQRPGRL